MPFEETSLGRRKLLESDAACTIETGSKVGLSRVETERKYKAFTESLRGVCQTVPDDHRISYHQSILLSSHHAFQQILPGWRTKDDCLWSSGSFEPSSKKLSILVCIPITEKSSQNDVAWEGVLYETRGYAVIDGLKCPRASIRGIGHIESDESLKLLPAELVSTQVARLEFDAEFTDKIKASPRISNTEEFVFDDAVRGEIIPWARRNFYDQFLAERKKGKALEFSLRWEKERDDRCRLEFVPPAGSSEAKQITLGIAWNPGSRVWICSRR